MSKILIVFRGDCNRFTDYQFIYNNIKLKILDPLNSKNYTYDIIASSYLEQLNNLNEFSKYFNPIKLYTMNKDNSTQVKQFMFTVNMIKTNINIAEYTKILFLRFDIVYKMSIINWKYLDTCGFIVPYKEDSNELFNTHKYHSDVFLSIDTNLFEEFYKYLNCIYLQYLNNSYTDIIAHEPFPLNLLHNVANILLYYNPNFIISYCIDGCYQSNTSVSDNRLSPLFICLSKQYHSNDIHLLF